MLLKRHHLVLPRFFYAAGKNVTQTDLRLLFHVPAGTRGAFTSSCFSFPALTDPNAAAAQQAMLQQQLSVLAYSPYGDSPLFRNPLSDPKKKEEVRAT